MSFPLINPKQQFFDSAGEPLSGGKIEFRDPATNVYLNTYPTADDADAGTNANLNPLTLDARGEAPVGIFLTDDATYKIILKDSGGTTIWTVDDIRSPSRGVDDAYTGTYTGAVATTIQGKLDNTMASFVADFNAAGDGSTDDATEIQAAVDGATHIYGGGKTYKVNSKITLPITKVVIRDATFDFSASADLNFFQQDGTVDTAQNLASNALEGAEAIVVSDGTQYAIGDYVWLKSNRVWAEAGSVQVDVSDVHQVKSIATNTLTLHSRLQADFNTADAATCTKINYAEGPVFENCKFIGAFNSSDNDRVLEATYSKGVRFENCDFSSVRGFAARLITCYDTKFKECTSYSQAYADSSGGSMVRIVDGCQHTWFIDNLMVESNQMFDTAGTYVNRYITVRGNTVIGCVANAGINTHPSSDQIKVIDNNVMVVDTGAEGIIIQGNNAIVSNNIVEGAFRHAIFYEYMGTGLDASSSGNAIISDNIVRGTGTTGILANNNAQNATDKGDIESLVISDNTIDATTNNITDAIRCRTVTGDIRGITINGNLANGFTGKGIHIDSDAGFIIGEFSVIGNNLDGVATPATAGIHLDSADNNGITNGTVAYNAIRNATTGVQGSANLNETSVVIRLGSHVGVTTDHTATLVVEQGQYTTAQRDALAGVPDGLIVLNTTTNKLNVRLNGAWQAITSS